MSFKSAPHPLVISMYRCSFILNDPLYNAYWNGHKSDTRNPANKIKTKLSAHVWELKDKGTHHDIKWDFIDRAPSFNTITKKCRLCLKEKYHIMYNPTSSTLNKRNEIFNTCRHRKQKLLINVKT